MKKHFPKIVSLALALCMVCAMSATALAAEIGTSGGSGTTPVSLTTTNGGVGGGGEVTPTKLTVVVPTALPMAMSDNGAVVTATDCKITNLSFGAVRVKSVAIQAVNSWKLTAFGDKASLAGEKVDSNKLGFSLAIGGGAAKSTDKTNAASQQLISAPVSGCYMTGAGDPDGNSVGISYAAIVTPLSSSVENATVANVVIIVEWDTAD